VKRKATAAISLNIDELAGNVCVCVCVCVHFSSREARGWEFIISLPLPSTVFQWATRHCYCVFLTFSHYLVTLRAATHRPTTATFHPALGLGNDRGRGWGGAGGGGEADENKKP